MFGLFRATFAKVMCNRKTDCNNHRTIDANCLEDFGDVVIGCHLGTEQKSHAV